MRLTTVPTELTTAATDLALAGLAAVCLVYLLRWRTHDAWRTGLWCAVLALLCISAALGAVVHGLDLTATAQGRLWSAVFLALGLTVALFVVAAAYDWGGATLARRALVPMLLVGGGFFVVTRLIAGTFLVFVVYEGAAMFLAFGIYAALAARRRLPRATVIAVGIALNVVAAAIQATGAITITLVWPFDHNGVFHLVQMVAVVVLVGGVSLGFTGRPDAHRRGVAEP